MVKEIVLTFLPKFELYENGSRVGMISKEFTLFHPKFDIDFNGWCVQGDWTEWYYLKKFGGMKMNCPYCGEEMKLGYIQARDGVTWDSKKRMVPALPALHADAIRLSLPENNPFSGGIVEAYNCWKCKKIIIDYSELR